MIEEKSVYSLTKSINNSNNVIDDNVQEGGSKDDNMDTFNEQLNEYYKLKNDYDKKIQSYQNSITKDNSLNLKQKQEKYRKMKMKCINCGRNVGTIFSNDGGILTAVCGDKINKCTLNIKINRGKYINLEELIDVFQSGVDEIKEEIIKVKMDLLFGYEQESAIINIFNKLKTDLSNDLESTLQYKTRFIEIVSNLDNKPELNVKMTMFYNKLATIKSTIEEFNETGRIQLIKDMVTMYDMELLPLLNEIRKLKYRYMAMEYNQETNTHTLVKKVFTIKDLLETFENPQVEYFEIGGINTKDDVVQNLSREEEDE